VSRNIEIKARIADPLALRRRVETLPSHGARALDQTDTFFRVARGRLKLREFGDGTGELIYYERPDQAQAKLSLYERIPCSAPAALRHALSAALGVRGVVRKHRDVFLLGSTRIHLDNVEELGSFLELEVVLADGDSIESGTAIAADLLRVLEIPEPSLVSGAYIDLIEQGGARAG
jgi:adenylate cyclase class IV